METVIQQMLPLGIERLRRYDLYRACFMPHYCAVPCRDANRERKNGAKN